MKTSQLSVLKRLDALVALALARRGSGGGGPPSGAAGGVLRGTYPNPGGAGLVQEIRFALALANASSVASIPAGSRIVDAELVVTTPYTGGATVSLGQTGTPTAFMLTTDNSPQSANSYAVGDQDVLSGAALPVLATVAGGPAAGAATVIVKYVATPVV